MGPIVSTSDPWGLYRPQQSSCLLVEELYPSEVQDCELAAELTELAGDSDALLPGLEATTWADLAEARAFDDDLDADLATALPAWCVTADSDTDLGVEHLIRPANGGSSFGYEGADVAVSLQLEQDHARAARAGQIDSAPMVVLQLQVNGQEQRAYLTATEAYELRALIGGLLTDIDTNS